MNKRKPVRKLPTYKWITIATFVVLTIYLLGYLATFLNQSTVAVERVKSGTLDVPVTFNGIIVRDEEVAKAAIDGVVSYDYSSGERLKKGDAVCQICKEDSVVHLEDQIASIDKNILAAQKERTDISAFKDDIRAVDEKIANTVYAYAYKFNDGNISDVYEFRSQLENQINRRNQIWYLEGTSSTSQLAAQRQQYSAQLSDSLSNVTMPSSGILSLYIDKYEEILTPDTIDSITKEQTNMKVSVDKLLTQSQSVMAEDPIFKVIRSNVWYVVGYLPNSATATWEVGNRKTLSAIMNEEEKTVPVTVTKLEVGDQVTRVVFRAENKVLDFLSLRTASFSIRSDSYEGLKIPNESIVEKTLIKIPIDCVQSSLETSNVIRRSSTGDALVPIAVLRADEQYVYILQDFETLKLGDTLIRGTGETATEYTLSEVITYQGVYVVNSSIATFTVVDIIGQNVDYAIVKPATLSNGLQISDSIVSDASSVQEGDEIY